jgi:hypothetical protein
MAIAKEIVLQVMKKYDLTYTDNLLQFAKEIYEIGLDNNEEEALKNETLESIEEEILNGKHCVGGTCED